MSLSRRAVHSVMGNVGSGDSPTLWSLYIRETSPRYPLNRR